MFFSKTTTSIWLSKAVFRIESSKDELRGVFLSRELFTILIDAKALIEQWWKKYNHVRPYSSSGSQASALEVILSVPPT